MNFLRKTNQPEYCKCSCGKISAGNIVKGGDGSLLFPRRHRNMKTGEYPCSGCNELAPALASEGSPNKLPEISPVTLSADLKAAIWIIRRLTGLLLSKRGYSFVFTKEEGELIEESISFTRRLS